jgi:flagellar biosynthesis protein FlhF
LRSMQGMLASHLSSMAWLDGVRRNPVQTQVLRHLMACGFSGGLARRLADRLPGHLSDRPARLWLADRLQKVIQVDAPGQSIIDRGGIYAITGSTGVGKTTTIAKLAAQFAMRYGTEAIGLVSVDAYRIGAQDQLRAFGRLLGVPVMVAHDAVSLAEFLHVFMRKKLVLIDTVGFGQNDSRVIDQLRALQHTHIQRLLVLNAGAQAEVLQGVIAAFKGIGLRGVIISKIDEAVKTGAVLDTVIRHRLPVIGIADGQRVPEDWQLTDPAALIARALSAPMPNAVELDDHEMTLLLQSASEPGALHA